MNGQVLKMNLDLVDSFDFWSDVCFIKDGDANEDLTLLVKWWENEGVNVGGHGVAEGGTVGWWVIYRAKRQGDRLISTGVHPSRLPFSKTEGAWRY